ncbi:hypothetical protein BD324DRAFT_611909 [Kockovaella imperatae]|uniref:Uncharacterized protein n=1 Tax=Kockovaella imperatae TaxID=4999 RepID=A0A1Y1USY0_9TREE|nr:hypothetical protein BD324DRAFT_611909 [Kockovaella imperatae]ORX40737.1 hypothetical protein BD324DRAFT_611909 [Kockovaella imperatae]
MLFVAVCGCYFTSILISVRGRVRGVLALRAPDPCLTSLDVLPLSGTSVENRPKTLRIETSRICDSLDHDALLHMTFQRFPRTRWRPCGIENAARLIQ